MYLIRQRTKHRQQKDRQHIVQCHDRSRHGLAQMIGILQDQGDDVVIHLPEGTDAKKSQSDQKRSFVI